VGCGDLRRIVHQGDARRADARGAWVIQRRCARQQGSSGGPILGAHQPLRTLDGSLAFRGGGLVSSIRLDAQAPPPVRRSRPCGYAVSCTQRS
jgi:hypothetical protein